MSATVRGGGVLVVLAAAALVAWTARPGGPWWAAVVGAAALWPQVVRAPPWRAAAGFAVALAPLPAAGFAGVRALDPWLWAAAVAGWALAYAGCGALAASVFGRRWPPAARPAAWTLGWAALDGAVVAGPAFGRLLPVTPGYLLLDGPLVAWAAVAGPVALGPVWTTASAALAAAVGGFGGAPAARRGAARGWSWAAGVVVLVAAALHGATRHAPLGTPVAVAVTHGTLDAAELAATRTDAMRAASNLDALVARADAWTAGLHVWPETALGYAAPELAPRLVAAAVDLGAPIVAGGYRRDADGGWRNAVVHATASAATWVVDKRHLVPGFEAWLVAGVGERWPLHAAGLRWGVLVCWESLHLGTVWGRGRAADALLVLAHDGWAAETATPWWHARSGRLLAWTLGRPVVVASHDGPSMAWGHDGTLLASAGPETPGMHVTVAAPTVWITPYARWGPGFATSMVAGALVATAAFAAAARSAVARGARDPARRDQGCGASGPQAA